MRFGACYYPEHWTKEQAKNDLELMTKARFNVVRLAEFSWVKMEPEEGRFDFAWLDAAIEKLWRSGIAVILGTPTAIPPNWLIAKHSDICLVNEQRLRLSHGTRHHRCLNNSHYREYSWRIVTEMARHYAQNQAVIGWQIDNELGCHNTARCYCEACAGSFREWLRGCYGSLDTLNEKWGNAFWGMTFTDWNQIPLPWPAPAGHSPSLRLDFYRFCSDTNVEFAGAQAEILRKNSPGKFITHNLLGLFPQIDYSKMARHLDLVTWDNYPKFRPGDWMRTAYSHDVVRSLGKPMWIMEQQSGPTGPSETMVLFPQPEPGEIRLWTYQAVAHEAEGLLYYRWRVCLYGSEQYWHGILDHDGVPRRRYDEVSQIGSEFANLGAELAGAESESQVAILRSYDALWSHQIAPGHPRFSYEDEILRLYTALRSRGVSVDLKDPEDSLLAYKLVMAPSLVMTNDKIVSNLTDFVKRGGALLVTYKSGCRTWHNAVTDKTLPGDFAELLGVSVEEVHCRHDDSSCAVAGRGKEFAALSGQAGKWLEKLRANSAAVAMAYADGPFARHPAMTVNRCGNGDAFYLGANLDDRLLQKIIDKLLTRAKVQTYPYRLPADVEVSLRWKKETVILFILNHGESTRSVRLPQGKWRDLLNAKLRSGTVSLPPMGVAILTIKGR